MKRIILLLLASTALLSAQDDFPIVADDLEVSLFARDPLVRNPCAITFDAKGRLCVGMGPQYRKPKPTTPGDSVWILIDNDGDGKADSRTQFATGFNSIQGLAWRGRDLYVANAPDLTIARDLDGDDEADEYIRLYTDLGNLEHGLHGLNFGPDGKLYMSKGNSKGLTQLPDRLAPKPFRDLWGVQAPGAPDFPEPVVFKKGAYQKLYHNPSDDWGLCGGVLRCNPDGSKLEIVSSGFRNPWDICFDDQFNWLGTDNDQTKGDKIFSPFYGAHFGWGHPWTYDWTDDQHLPLAPSAGPFFEGSGTGVIYCGLEHFPQKYRDIFLINDWLRREVYIYRPKWNGAWMQADREKLEIFAHAGGGRAMGQSKGRSFDPVDIELGPDGAIYLSSWGREYGLTEKDGVQVNEGRIYRIWPKAAPPKPFAHPKHDKPITKWSADELFTDLGSHLPVWRTNAQEELIRRGWDDEAPQPKNVPETKRFATWLLWTIGRLEPDKPHFDELLAMLLTSEGSEFSPIHVLRALTHRLRERGATKLPEFCKEYFTSTDARVRHELVLALHQVGEVGWNEELLKLLETEQDRIVYYSAWQALRALVPAAERRLLLDDQRPAVRRAALLSLLEEDILSDPEITPFTKDKDQLTAALATRRLGGKVKTEIRGPKLNPNRREPIAPNRRPVSVVSQITSHPGSRYEEAVLQKDSRAYTDRSYRILDLPPELADLTFIRSANIDADFTTGRSLKLNLRYPSTLYLADDERGGGLPTWAREKWKATDLRLRTNDATHRLYTAQFPAGEITLGSNLAGIDARKSNYLVIIKPHLLKRDSDPQTPTEKDVLALLPKSDAERGRALFLSQTGAACTRCHQLEGFGNVFAPDLKDIEKRTDASFLVRSLLDPSADITEGFALQVLTTKDNKTIAGIVLDETGRALRIVQVDGSVVSVSKNKVAERKTAPASAMPPFNTLATQDLADLVAYLLRSPKSKAVAAPPKAEANPVESTSGTPSPLSGKTWGDPRNGLHLDCHDDRLDLDLNGKQVAVYYYRHPQTKRPFFAHVKTPSGIQVTRNFPPIKDQDATDHAFMHPGLSLGFANFEGVSFWHNKGAIVVQEEFVGEPTAARERATFAVANRYLAPDGQEMAREIARYVITTNKDGYLISLNSRLSSDREFWLGVREEMGLAMRVATPLTVKNGGAILGASGGRNEKGTWGKVDRWWDYYGPLAQKQVGIQLMSGPNNSPVWSHSRDYGLLVANPLPVDRAENRDKRITIKPGEQFQLQFGIQVHEH